MLAAHNGLLAALALALFSIATAAAFAGDRMSDKANLTGSVTKGPAPLAVTFTGGSASAFFGGIEIEFGDGEKDYFCRPGKGCRDATANHTYARPGTYTARIVGHGEGTSLELASLAVTVE